LANLAAISVAFLSNKPFYLKSPDKTSPEEIFDSSFSKRLKTTFLFKNPFPNFLL
jgi:hypothetical protein